ncbi:hypothetical protein JOC70_002496 [Clostridium pascui]|nr:hypothetical protein [Clostridium pascui]MBM7871002.1 hypothetical protein [Clostridium pascui]
MAFNNCSYILLFMNYTGSLLSALAYLPVCVSTTLADILFLYREEWV